MAGMSGLGDAVLFLIGGSWRCPFLMPSSLYSFSFSFAFFSCTTQGNRGFFFRPKLSRLSLVTRRTRKERVVRRTSPDCIGVSGFMETMNDWFGLVCFSLL